MDIDGLLELLRKRRSVREFKPDPVPDECIEKILEAGRWAMSGANGQPWEFILLKEKETIREIERIHTAFFRQAMNTLELTRIEEIRQPTIFRSLAGVLPGFRDAPVIIAILGDLRMVQASVIGAAVYHGNMPVQMGIANACQLMHVAAAAQGLGSQWLTIGPVFEGEFRKFLGVPEVFTIQMMMPLGYPKQEPKPGFRRSLKEMVHRERYDMSKFRSNQDIIDYVIKLRKIMKQAYPIGKDDSKA